MNRKIMLAGRRVVLQPGDIVLSRPEPPSLLSRAIRWRPFSKVKHTNYSHAMGLASDARTLVSAERGRVRKMDITDYILPKYSIAVIRPQFRVFGDDVAGQKVAVRAQVGEELEKLVGTKYSYLGLAGYAIDTLLSFKFKLFKKRIFSRLLGRADKKVYCSELVATAWAEAGVSFLIHGQLKVLAPKYATRPRDIEWTGAVAHWAVVFKTYRGRAVRNRYDACLKNPHLDAQFGDDDAYS